MAIAAKYQMTHHREYSDVSACKTYTDDTHKESLRQADRRGDWLILILKD